MNPVLADAADRISRQIESCELEIKSHQDAIATLRARLVDLNEALAFLAPSTVTSPTSTPPTGG